jgi:hypothetical protein
MILQHGLRHVVLVLLFAFRWPDALRVSFFLAVIRSEARPSGHGSPAPPP